MATCLPALHFVAYVVMFGWNAFPNQAITNGTALRFALNGPVLVLLDIAKWIASISWVSPHIRGGAGPIYFIFLTGGAALWYLVGRALDGLRKPNAPTQMNLTTGSVLVNSLALAWGIRLAISALHYFPPGYPHQHFSFEKIIEGIVVLLWSLILIVFPLKKLLTGLRGRAASPRVSDGG